MDSHTDQKGPLLFGSGPFLPERLSKGEIFRPCVFRFACKKCLENSLGTVIAYRYMKTVEWVFRNIDKDSLLDRSIFDILRSLYDEERIEALTRNPDVQSAPSRKAIPSIETPLPL